jgi:hypothetical protein
MQIDYLQNDSGRKGKGEEFAKIDLPLLLWGRACDMVLLGQTDQGIAEMMKVVTAYPQHPDFPKWVETVTAQVKALPPKAAPPSKPVPPAPANNS